MGDVENIEEEGVEEQVTHYECRLCPGQVYTADQRDTHRLEHQLRNSNRQRDRHQRRFETQLINFTSYKFEARRKLEYEQGRRKDIEKKFEEAKVRIQSLENLLKQKEEDCKEVGRKHDRMKGKREKARTILSVLCSEKEEISKDKYKYSSFARQIKELSNFEDGNDNLLENNQLERIVAHIQQIFGQRDVGNGELARNREMMRQLGDMFFEAQGESLSPADVKGHHHVSTSNIDPPGSNNLLTSSPENVPPTTSTTTSAGKLASSPQDPLPFPNNSTVRSPLKAEPMPPTSPDQNHDDPHTQPTTESDTSNNRDIKSMKPKSTNNSSNNRNNGQLTEYAITTKMHGVNKACSQFKCICGNRYSNGKGLNVHIRKMTKPWKYKCDACLHYFFYKSNLNLHLTQSRRCAGSGGVGGGEVPGGEDVTGSANSLIDELVGIRTGNSSTNVKKSVVPKKDSKRKLQQNILRRKKHAPWLSKKGHVQDTAWYCICGSKFNSKNNLAIHIQYFTQDWKFKCRLCTNERFLYLSYLKRHLTSTHKIMEPMSQFKMGCQICGMLFRKRSKYYWHRKIIHNLFRKNGNGGTRSKLGSIPPAPSSSGLARSTNLVHPKPPIQGPSTSSARVVTEQSNPPSSSTSDIIYIPPPPKNNMEIVNILSDDDDDETVKHRILMHNRHIENDGEKDSL